MCVRESENETLTENNTVIEYDTERGTFMLRKGIRVKDFFAINGRVYYTQAESPYEVLLYNARENEGSYLDMPMGNAVAGLGQGVHEAGLPAALYGGRGRKRPAA